MSSTDSLNTQLNQIKLINTSLLILYIIYSSFYIYIGWVAWGLSFSRYGIEILFNTPIYLFILVFLLVIFSYFMKVFLPSKIKSINRFNSLFNDVLEISLIIILSLSNTLNIIAQIVGVIIVVLSLYKLYLEFNLSKKI